MPNITPFYIGLNELKRNTKPPLGSVIDFNNPLSKGLVLEMPFLEGSGNKTMDLSGNRNHGTLYGSGKKWNSNDMKFNGVNDYILLNVNKYISKLLPFTIIIKIFLINNSIEQTIIRNAILDTDRFVLQHIAGYICAECYGSQIDYGIASTTSLKRNTFYHITYTYNGNSVGRMYNNGVKTTTVTSPYHIGGNITMEIGADLSPGNGYYTNGLISIARIHNRVLSQSEITELYKYPYSIYKSNLNRYYSTPIRKTKVLRRIVGKDPLNNPLTIKTISWLEETDMVR